MKGNKLLLTGMTYFLLLLVAVATTFPFVWMFLGCFKTNTEITSMQLGFLPEKWILDNTLEIFKLVPFAQMFANSVIVALAQIFAQVLTSSLAAYSFARLKWKGREAVFTLYLSTLMLPIWVVVIPSFLLV